MLQQFKKDFRLNCKTFLILQTGLLGAFLFGVILVTIIMNVDDDPGSWFCMGTLLACVVLCFVSLTSYAFGYFQEFQLALSMGRGRMAFLGAYALRLVIHFAVGYAIILGLHQLELALYPVLFPQYENEVFFAFLTDWRIVLPVFMGLAVLTLFLGALYGRYGRKASAIIWVLWLFCCIILPRMVDAYPEGTGVMDRASNWMLAVILAVPVSVWIPFGIALAAAMVATTVVFAQKQTVR